MGHCFSKSYEIPISDEDSPPRRRSTTTKTTRPHQPATPAKPKPALPIAPAQRPSSSFSKPAIPPSQLGPVLKNPYVDIGSTYILDKELGRGHFGVTYLCTEKYTGRKYACKSISRGKLTTEKDIEDVRREILILEHLSGQPNIVEFRGAYEDRQNLYVVMELCSGALHTKLSSKNACPTVQFDFVIFLYPLWFCAGGELFDRIIAKGVYSEREAANICRQIVNVVHVCHFMGVMHRDLKPENFLLASKDEDSPLKVTDFGLSVFIEDGQLLDNLQELTQLS